MARYYEATGKIFDKLLDDRTAVEVKCNGPAPIPEKLNELRSDQSEQPP